MSEEEGITKTVRLVRHLEREGGGRGRDRSIVDPPLSMEAREKAIELMGMVMEGREEPPQVE